MNNTFNIFSGRIAIHELLFYHVAKLANGEVQDIFNRLVQANIDNTTRGFWVWDFKNNVEYYSDGFRDFLGYSKDEFPDVPESWQSKILEDDKELAIENAQLHIESKGEQPYIQEVGYLAKDGSIKRVLCHGTVVSWNGDDPLVMIGIHLDTNETVAKFQKGNQKVYFHDMAKLKGQGWVNFVKGCDAKMKRFDDNSFQVICRMYPDENGEPAELETHVHPDFNEEFEVEKGFILDKISGRIVKAGESIIFNAGTPHHIVVYEETEMFIIGKKIK